MRIGLPAGCIKVPTGASSLRIQKPWRAHPAFTTSLATLMLIVAAAISMSLMPEVHAYTANAFVMVVKTDNPGTSNSTSFTIPITGTGYSYNVDCNDDGVNEVTARTTSYTCAYGAAGTYTIAITGTFPRIYFNNAGDRQKLLEVKQWGTGVWASMGSAFRGCNNLHITATDAPNLTVATDMSRMFELATSMNENINGWNTSHITNMSYLFAGGFDGTQWAYAAFNQPLTNWNTGAVTNMSGMFSWTIAFNQPLTNFNTSAVTNMSWMFSNATAFNQPLTNWNTSAVTNMSWMFFDATAFNQPLTNWNTGAVTDMSYMFYNANAFNQPLTSFNTGAVTNMSRMFSFATAFNQPLNNWNTSAVTDMSGMFSDATAFNQPLTNWNTGAVTNMSGMFSYSGYTTATYDQTLMHFASQSLQPNVALGATGITYCEDTAHITLTSPPNNWTITDGGFCPPAITSPANLAVVSDATPAITGTAKPSRTVHIDLDGSSYTTSASATGDYSFTIPTALTNGWHTATVRSTDQAGALGVPTQVAFYVHSGGDIALSGSMVTPTLTWPAAPETPVGTIWRKTAVGDSSFTARYWHSAVSFKGKLWVFGGYGYDAATMTQDDLNDIWSSPDGVTWTKEAAAAPWGKREGLNVIEFNGKLWLMGGYVDEDGSYRNDIWSSPDGVTWTRVVEHAPWTELGYYPQLAVLNGKLFLTDGDGSHDSVYSTTDGITWTRAVEHAPWVGRDEFTATVFEGRIWVMGGWSGNGADIWSSADGITWTQVKETADWPGRAEHAATVHDGKLWIMGGDPFEGSNMLNDVWSSSAQPPTYTVCWDTVQGGCAHSATTTNAVFTIPEDLTKTTWCFKVSATIPNADGAGTYTATPYQVTDPMPVSTPLAGKSIVHPVTGAASTEKLPEALTGAVLSVASYDCSDLQAPTVRLVEPDGLKAPQADVTLLGGVGFSVGCTSNGKATDVSLALGTSYNDTSKLRAYKQSGTTLVDITKQVTFTNKTINGATKTVVNYTLTDGASLDEDGAANGTIVDPIFIGVLPGVGDSLAATGTNVFAIAAGAVTVSLFGVVVVVRMLGKRGRARRTVGRRP